MGDFRIEEWNGVVIRAITHRQEYAADKIFKGETTEQWTASLRGDLQDITDWFQADQKASEGAGARDSGIDTLRAAINGYNDSIAGEFGKDSVAYQKRPRLTTRIEGWPAVVTRAIEHRQEYAAAKVFKEQTTEQWIASLQDSLQPITRWIEADQKADHKAGARDMAIESIRAKISQYESSIAGEFGRQSEAYRTRPRISRTASGGGTTTPTTNVEPSK